MWCGSCRGWEIRRVHHRRGEQARRQLGALWRGFGRRKEKEKKIINKQVAGWKELVDRYDNRCYQTLEIQFRLVLSRQASLHSQVYPGSCQTLCPCQLRPSIRNFRTKTIPIPSSQFFVLVMSSQQVDKTLWMPNSLLEFTYLAQCNTTPFIVLSFRLRIYIYWLVDSPNSMSICVCVCSDKCIENWANIEPKTNPREFNT